jgi:hypothetical protein
MIALLAKDWVDFWSRSWPSVLSSGVCLSRRMFQYEGAMVGLSEVIIPMKQVRWKM